MLIIEHNLDTIKVADYLIDLGLEYSDLGGEVVVAGTPEEICTHEGPYTGQHLQPFFSTV